VSETLVTRFFDDRWMRENAKDVERARELTAEARRKLATMTTAEFLADAQRTIEEADALIKLLAEENEHGAN
jgi:hypothetical protein